MSDPFPLVDREGDAGRAGPFAVLVNAKPAFGRR